MCSLALTFSISWWSATRLLYFEAITVISLECCIMSACAVASWRPGIKNAQSFGADKKYEFCSQCLGYAAWPQPMQFSEFAQYILGGWADYPWDQRSELSNNGFPFKGSLRVSSGLLPGGWMLRSERKCCYPFIASIVDASQNALRTSKGKSLPEFSMQGLPKENQCLGFGCEDFRKKFDAWVLDERPFDVTIANENQCLSSGCKDFTGKINAWDVDARRS